jgi:hypothetical protein
MTRISPKKIMKLVEELLSVSEYGIQQQPGNKLFIIERGASKAKLQSTIDELTKAVNYVTADDQMNGIKPRTILYAFLNEKVATADGFSFQVK